MLIVEKETVLFRLEDSNFHVQNNCILLSGKGIPDIASRMMIKRISQEFPRMPIYLLVDPDPDGLTVASIYILGSQNRRDLKVRKIKLLG
jgi:meiotic recombination protein SPO11